MKKKRKANRIMSGGKHTVLLSALLLMLVSSVQAASPPPVADGKADTRTVALSAAEHHAEHPVKRVAIAFDFPFGRRFSIPFGQRPLVPPNTHAEHPAERENFLRKEEGRPLRKVYNGYPIPQKEKNFYNLEKSFK